MKAKPVVILLVTIVVAAACGAGVISYIDGNAKTTFTTVTGTIHQYVKQKPKLEPLEDLGTNLALNLETSSSGITQDKAVDRANDGDVLTYWEGTPDSYPNSLWVDLRSVKSVKAVRIKLNPDPIWEKRSQTFSITGSTDDKNYTAIVDTAEYVFDPDTNGNVVTIKFDAVDVQYVKLTFTANTAATAGQAGEFEVY
ncbi:MAG TPA: discoidin domain-containing protein [Clostridia bacterium]|nr:discoidin domain-containing protein [Clostridia bacterium]